MTEELHLRISGKGWRDGLGEATLGRARCPRVPECPCPRVPTSSCSVSPGPRSRREDEGKSFSPLELPLIALKSLEKGLHHPPCELPWKFSMLLRR